MSGTKETTQTSSSHTNNGMRFNITSIIMIFAIIFLLTETSFAAVAFATVVFIIFLKEGIDKEMNAIRSSH